MIGKPSWWEIRWATKSDGYKYNGSIKGPKGLVVHSTAAPGADADAIFNNFNRANRGASIHGALDNNKFIQMMPFTQKAGHVGSASKGSFNPTHLGIELCEPKGLVYNTKTWAIESYNPPAGYFASIWDKATTLYAYLCQEYNINPLQHDANGGIVAHYEAHALGYGDNHGDPRGWFSCEGKTMDDFRQAVADKLAGKINITDDEEDDMTVERFGELYQEYMAQKKGNNPSPWAEPACKEAVDLGLVKGDGEGNFNWQDAMSREAQMTILKRAGLFEIAKKMGLLDG